MYHFIWVSIFNMSFRCDEKGKEEDAVFYLLLAPSVLYECVACEFFACFRRKKRERVYFIIFSPFSTGLAFLPRVLGVTRKGKRRVHYFIFF